VRNEVLGEYVAHIGWNGDLSLDRRKYVLRCIYSGMVLEGYFIIDENGRRVAATTRDISSLRFYFEPVDLRPEDPDQWLLAINLIHFIFNFHGQPRRI
jgi:hypothetical protein